MCDQKKGRNIKNKTQQPSKHPRPRTVGMAVHLLSVPTAPPCNMYYICVRTVWFRFFASLRLYLQFPAYFYLYSMSFSCIRKKSFRTSFWRAEYHSSPRMTLIPPFPGWGPLGYFYFGRHQHLCTESSLHPWSQAWKCGTRSQLPPPLPEPLGVGLGVFHICFLGGSQGTSHHPQVWEHF